MTFVWVRRNEDKPHRCPRCHSIVAWDRDKWGPRTKITCVGCGVRWRAGNRWKRYPMRSIWWKRRKP